MLGLPPKNSSSQIAVATVAFLNLNGPAVQKISSSQIAVATLQLSCWACRPKTSSSQIAVAALQLSCWARRHKNLKYAECSCYPAAFLLGLPPKNLEKSDCSYYPAALLLGLPRKNPKYGQIAVAIAAFLILNGPAVQKISSGQIAVATLQLFCWACCLKNLKYADCSCSAASNNFEIDDIHNQIRANQHCL